MIKYIVTVIMNTVTSVRSIKNRANNFIFILPLLILLCYSFMYT